ncbi:MAG TPA: hypothetical protein VGQ36_06335 [Thermoanaerobaculia bacterium]|jgi:hypothetical protein|nr:hypothetical protein [Thermoanaerobaculia bacterium]
MPRKFVWVAVALLFACAKIEPSRTDRKADIPRNGLALWLAADDAQPNEVVDVWQNPELTGPRANALSIAAQPKRVANALNGHAVVRFDGVDDIMKTTIEFGRGRMEAATVFAVFSSATAAASPLRKLYGCDNGGFDPAAGLDDRADTNYGVFTGGGAHPYFVLEPNHYYLTSDVWKWTEFTGYVDGHLKIDHLPITSDTDTLPNLFLGGTGTVYYEHWQGDIAEVIVFSRALEDAERRKVEDYLAEKYAVTLHR